MKRSKILMGIGAIVLAAGAVVAGRASVKFANPAKLYYTAGLGSTCKEVASAITVFSNRLTTSSAGGAAPAYIHTSTSSNNYKLYATISNTNVCSKPVFFSSL